MSVYTHDLGDVWCYAVKMAVDSRYKNLTLSLYILLLCTWLWTRCYVFPSLYYQAIWLLDIQVTNAFFLGMTSLYVVLQSLHIYWFVLLLKMGWTFSKSGELKDIQQQCLDVDEKRKDS